MLAICKSDALQLREINASDVLVYSPFLISTTIHG